MPDISDFCLSLFYVLFIRVETLRTIGVSKGGLSKGLGSGGLYSITSSSDLSTWGFSGSGGLTLLCFETVHP